MCVCTWLLSGGGRLCSLQPSSEVHLAADSRLRGRGGGRGGGKGGREGKGKGGRKEGREEGGGEGEDMCETTE